MSFLDELRADCGYSDGSDGEETGVESLIAYKDALEDALGVIIAGRVVVCLSGADVLEVRSPEHVRVEVRQYHADYRDSHEHWDGEDSHGRFEVHFETEAS